MNFMTKEGLAEKLNNLGLVHFILVNRNESDFSPKGSKMLTCYY